MTAVWSRLRDVLPRGGELPADVWQHRHRGLVVLLWLHVPGIAVFGIVRDVGVQHALVEASAIAALALTASFAPTATMRMVAATLGLMASSGVIVHLSDGSIEAHFHFFVMVAAVTLYQDWLPFLLSVAFVVTHHGVVGVLDSHAVYNHPAAQARPWQWAGIHGLFILGESVALLAAWRTSENERAHAADYALQLQAKQLAQRQALEINDAVVQGLTVSSLALETGDTALASQALGRTLDAARSLIGRLLHETSGGEQLRAGDLVREAPAEVLPLTGEPAR
jgi:hypothetical protein